MTFLIFDILVVIIIFLFVIKGANDGFIATVVKFFSVAIAFVVALIVCKWLAQFVYDGFFHEKIVTSLKDMKLITDSTGAVRLQESLKNLGGIIGFLAANFAGGFTAGLEGLSEAQVSAALGSMASEISNTLVRPMFVSVFSTIFFLVVFMILGLILSLFSKGLKSINKVPLVGAFNRGLGFISGIGIGFVWVLVLVQIIKLWVLVSGNTNLQVTINETYIFQFFYNLKLF